ncbi:MAG: hypothetical protein WC284_12685 [Candidimonas sp.]
MKTSEISNSGTYVGVRLGPKSEKALYKWALDNNIDQPVFPEDYHCTLLLHKSDTFWWRPVKYRPMIRLEPSTYEIEFFGDESNIMVLSFSSPELEKLHKRGRKELDLPWDYPSYSPHITLSYGGNNKKIDPPNFYLYLSHEYVTPFKMDWVDKNN